jgi:hypothetical protein
MCTKCKKNIYINLLGSSVKRRTVISEQASCREGKKKGAVHRFDLFKWQNQYDFWW